MAAALTKRRLAVKAKADRLAPFEENTGNLPSNLIADVSGHPLVY